MIAMLGEQAYYRFVKVSFAVGITLFVFLLSAFVSSEYLDLKALYFMFLALILICLFVYRCYQALGFLQSVVYTSESEGGGLFILTFYDGRSLSIDVRDIVLEKYDYGRENLFLNWVFLSGDVYRIKTPVKTFYARQSIIDDISKFFLKKLKTEM